ncbi:hypothetical protein EVAR_100604_1 [Eumeta japonica]|uniref:Uncharacterized protein n=1 Tax=Eumeta variegata TaxID=151549 RepID=A0A4C2A9J7_EUMVA|nr:hypothetical protein EVAR_100604_1 [Eumeta japonica]
MNDDVSTSAAEATESMQVDGLGTYILRFYKFDAVTNTRSFNARKHTVRPMTTQVDGRPSKPLSAARQREQSEINLSVLAFSAKISPC